MATSDPSGEFPGIFYDPPPKESWGDNGSTVPCSGAKHVGSPRLTDVFGFCRPANRTGCDTELLPDLYPEYCPLFRVPYPPATDGGLEQVQCRAGDNVVTIEGATSGRSLR